jgi:vancomycin permeability regulator SanA
MKLVSNGTVKRYYANKLRAPALYDAGKEALLWVVSDVGSKTVDNVSKMIVETTHNLWYCHSRLEILQDLGE